MGNGRKTETSGEDKKRPRIQKEKLKDLDLKDADSIKGGKPGISVRCAGTTRNAMYC